MKWRETLSFLSTLSQLFLNSFFSLHSPSGFRCKKMGRMSDLPDHLVRMIVGFLGAKEAAYLLILSRRFRNLHTIRADLKFDDRVFQGNFSDFVSEALAQLEIDTLVRRFSLKSQQFLDPGRIRQWLNQVLKRGVVDVRLSIHPDNGDALPSELFTCSTIAKLKLGREFVIAEIPRAASLPSLETLILKGVRFYSLDVCAFSALLSACPILKELTIDGGWRWDKWKWSGILSSHSLRRLVIQRAMYHGLDGADYQGISFDTPSLTYLDYMDFVPDAYPIVNMESLEEAKLHLQVVAEREWHGRFAAYGDDLSSNATNLIQGIRNVKVLKLSYPLTFETLYCFRQEIPVFQNLHRLIINNDDDLVCWNFLPFLLNKSPNLKTLILKSGLHYVRKNRYEENDDHDHDYVCQCVSGYAYLLSCRVEVLDIYLWDDGTEGELEQIEHFLGKLSCLQLLTLRGRVTAMEKSSIITHLLMLPRASHRCHIEFI